MLPPRALPAAHFEQGALILLRGDECLHCKRRLNNCLKELEPDNGHGTRHWHYAAPSHLPLRPALGAASPRYRWIVGPVHGGGRNCPRELQYRQRAAAW